MLSKVVGCLSASHLHFVDVRRRHFRARFLWHFLKSHCLHCFCWRLDRFLCHSLKRHCLQNCFCWCRLNCQDANVTLCCLFSRDHFLPLAEYPPEHYFEHFLSTFDGPVSFSSIFFPLFRFFFISVCTPGLGSRRNSLQSIICHIDDLNSICFEIVLSRIHLGFRTDQSVKIAT